MPLYWISIKIQTLPSFLEEKLATHSSTLAWKIPWTEEPGRVHFMGSQRVGHEQLSNWACMYAFFHETCVVWPCLAHCGSATLVLFEFLKCSGFFPAGFFYMVFVLPEMFFRRLSMWLTPCASLLIFRKEFLTNLSRPLCIFPVTASWSFPS